ncbi:MAG: c-type cytochrome [Sulfurovum sp.]|nr:c-type cytochrome [Sulfurovum sp.]
MIKKTLVLMALGSTMMLATSPETLIKTNCAACHMLTTPTADMIPTLKAPAMDAVMFHINLAISDKKEVKAFIVDYAMNPKIKKSVCESNKVTGFGVMPSLKGKISDADLSTVADYMMENFPTPAFVKMITEMQTNGKMNALLNSPFLINQTALPHMTKVLIENWEKGTLALTAEQKEKLLVVRKETMTAVKQIKGKVKVLEAEIITLLIDAEESKEMDVKVDALAKLKAEATKAHLKCIAQTVEILDDEQMELLFPFFDS